VSICGKFNFVESDFTVRVDDCIIHADPDYIRDEHIVCAERNNLTHFALHTQRTFRDGRAFDIVRSLFGELALLEFINLFAGINPAVIGGMNHRGCREIDNELAADLDDFV